MASHPYFVYFAQVLFKNGEFRNHLVYNIAKEVVPEIGQKEVIGIKMPMIKDETSLMDAHESGADTIMSKLADGKNVAFLTLGDPTIFSTYTYIQKLVEANGYETKIVSGIASFLSAAAQLNTKLVVRDEMLHIIPW